MLRKLLYFAVIVVIFAAGLFAGRYLEQQRFFVNNRLGYVLRLIQEQYVDSVQMDSLQDQAIPLLLSGLDPHSTYLSAELNKRENEGLFGAFEGIGILFNRFTDTIVISRIIEGGASQRAGLKAGDRILKADTANLIGAHLSDETIMGLLKGPSNSVVRLLIKRQDQERIVSVVRGPVPVSTIDAAYTARPGILYIRINKWGARTHQEVLTAYAQHLDNDIKGMVIDLRDNSGGFLESALALAGEFLRKGQLILYAEGRAFPREDFVNPKDGLLSQMPLVVLVNEFSASSSEIFAGVMQDQDRASIVGRRTFGKGLVQQTFMLADSSVVRLTVARYFTPSGRSLQKSYSAGDLEGYASDLLRRAEHGEYFSADSISQTDTTHRYYTKGGRMVLGGGGITPDIFIPRDTTGRNSYYLRLLNAGIMPRFAFHYADRHRAQLEALGSTQALIAHLKSLGSGLLFEFAYYAQAKGVPIRTTLLHQASTRILDELRAMIADHIAQDRNAFFQILMEQSPELNRGLDLIEQNAWAPGSIDSPDDQASL